MTQKPTLTREQHRILIEHLLDDSTFSQLAKDQIAELGRGYLAYLDMVPRPIKPDDKAILVKLKSPCHNMDDGEFLVLSKWPNGNWHSSGANVYIIGEDFENLVYALPTLEGET